MSQKLADDFHTAMLGIHAAALKLKPPYRPTEFLRMVQSYGGKETAARLLATPNPSSGFTELFLRGKDKLRLSVEYLVLQHPWRDLFTAEQRARARKRLQDVEFPPPPEDVEVAAAGPP